MDRKAYADALRGHGLDFNRPGVVAAFDALMEKAGIPAANASPAGFDHALAIILQHEGGFVNNPKDPGGMTNLGVTRGTLESWHKRKVTEAEMRALTPASVAPIYRANYWDACKCDDLHPALALCVFDFAVNAGPGRAVRYLQGMVQVSQDGQAGTETVGNAKTYVSAHGPAFAVRSYQDARRGYYRHLPTFATFGRGWLRRCDETETEALRLA